MSRSPPFCWRWGIPRKWGMMHVKSHFNFVTSSFTVYCLLSHNLMRALRVNANSNLQNTEWLLLWSSQDIQWISRQSSADGARFSGKIRQWSFSAFSVCFFLVLDFLTFAYYRLQTPTQYESSCLAVLFLHFCQSSCSSCVCCSS